MAAKFMEDYERQNPKEGSPVDPDYETQKVFTYHNDLSLFEKKLNFPKKFIFKDKTFWNATKFEKKKSHLFWSYWVNVKSKRVGDFYKFCDLLIKPQPEKQGSCCRILPYELMGRKNCNWGMIFLFTIIFILAEIFFKWIL